MPALFAAFFVSLLYGRARLQRGLQAGLFTGMIVLLPFNTLSGLVTRDWYEAGMAGVERDLAAGVPRSELAKHHGDFLLHWDERALNEGMLLLKRAQIGPFQDLADDGVNLLTTSLIDGFEENTLKAWSTYNSIGSSSAATLGSPGRQDRFLMRYDYSVVRDGYVGIGHFFRSTQDWRRSSALELWVRSTSNNLPVIVEILDGPSDGVSGDIAERFVANFEIRGEGWRRLLIPWGEFLRRSWQPEGAPDDGLDLSRVGGYGFFISNRGSGRVEMDDVALVRWIRPSENVVAD
jgi:hypothetical protein